MVVVLLLMMVVVRPSSCPPVLSVHWLTGGVRSLLFALCRALQVYESKLQELQKQVETCSLAVETPDEEEDEDEEEEGAFFFQS